MRQGFAKFATRARSGRNASCELVCGESQLDLLVDREKAWEKVSRQFIGFLLSSCPLKGERRTEERFNIGLTGRGGTG